MEDVKEQVKEAVKQFTKDYASQVVRESTKKLLKELTREKKAALESELKNHSVEEIKRYLETNSEFNNAFESTVNSIKEASLEKIQANFEENFTKYLPQSPPTSFERVIRWVKQPLHAGIICIITAIIAVALVALPNHPPDPPFSLYQFRLDGIAQIPFGGATDESGIVIKGEVSDPDGDNVRLDAEVRPADEPFSDVKNCDSDPEVASGDIASARCTGLPDGRYHWQVRSIDNKGAYSAWQSQQENPETGADFIVDTTFPSGSIAINNGSAYTTSASVVLSLTSSDSVSGVGQVRYSNDGNWDAENWEAPSPTKSWILTSGDGEKTVYYQIKNEAGRISDTYSATIILDTTDPTGSININNGYAYTTSASVILSLTYYDQGSGVEKVRYSNDGNWGTASWEVPVPARSWTLTGGDGIKTVFYQVRDKAGRISKTYSANIMLDTIDPTGSITINNGDAETHNTSVTLYLTYFDSGSGVDKVRYSNNSPWDGEPWEAPALTKSWTLSGYGDNTVYYQIRDKAGRISETYSATIRYYIPLG